MKPLLLCIVVIAVTSSPILAQEGKKKTIPILVSHLSAENNAITRRKDAPRHTIFTKVICFKKKCRAYIGWKTRQQKMRFKGYKKSGVPRKTTQPLAPPKDSIIAQPVMPSVVADTVHVPKQQLFILDEVLFEIGSAQLNSKFTFRLDSLISLLGEHTNLYVQVSGHTDNTGSESNNIKLSTDRAASVATYLVNHGVERHRISYQGFGSARPITPNNSLEGRRKNRRVEILISEN
jgi:outer membrane protein OmpA-like peptidoglycan-associated protein